MKKIMFNDRYGLTQAVIEGRKTMTRRIMNNQSGNLAGCVGFTKNGRACTYVRADFDNGISEDAPYAIGEIVAVAQSYRDVCAGGFEPDATILRLFEERRIAGWTNKMFTKAELMPYRIRITGIKCERLQDISDEDCMKEGVLGDVEYDKYEVYGLFGNSDDGFDTPREAFASLIDKISSCGTWAHNPWVVVYEFELVK
ncbi:hypothetical protein [Alistipes communis]|uniref:hypothetical protein n=1 Tax=Alistipes communis TaxID=2585118 RepID=UPI00189750B1|nr:hypothetical protein [Alistipes communis]